jgi:heme exporter protein C
MKFIIMFSAIGIALILGFLHKQEYSKPNWWKWLTVLITALALFLTIYPQIAGNWTNTRLVREGIYETVNTAVTIEKGSHSFDEVTGFWSMKIDGSTAENRPLYKMVYKGSELPPELKSEELLILKLAYNQELNEVVYVSTLSVSPWIYYPFVPSLDHRMKILNLHVPMAWIAVIAYMVSMIYGIRYLRSRELSFDIKSSSAAVMGTIFSILATTTGMLWAKYNWGEYWSWDPRQTSIFVLILIYFAYFGLRSSINTDELKAKLSAVYSIIAFITVPFLIFVLPRLAAGLHPGSADDKSIGPVISPQPSSLDSTLSYSFGLALLGFTLLFFWLFNIHVRYKTAKDKLNID